MRYKKEEKALFIQVWDDREHGRHGWTPRGENWLTVEPIEDDGDDLLHVVLTNHIDDLGYPFGTVLNFDYIDEKKIEKWRKENASINN